MSRFDEEREETIRILYSILDYARLGFNVSTYNSCNNCGDKYCKYKPDWCDPVRFNCPLWTSERKEE